MRMLCVQGVTFAEFKEFCQFLNNLDDFALAMRIYTYASQPISESTLCSHTLSYLMGCSKTGSVTACSVLDTWIPVRPFANWSLV